MNFNKSQVTTAENVFLHLAPYAGQNKMLHLGQVTNKATVHMIPLVEFFWCLHYSWRCMISDFANAWLGSRSLSSAISARVQPYLVCKRVYPIGELSVYVHIHTPVCVYACKH